MREAIDDLQHDLGKYLRMPLAMLPRDAGVDAVRAAVDQALRRTRRGRDGEVAARVIWADFERAHGAALGVHAEWTALREAVRRALAWEGAAHVERAVVERDLGAVSEAIRALGKAVG